MFYGCDSKSDDFPCGADFYIGRIGYGTTTDYTFFIDDAAARVGCNRTWSYWFLQGPSASNPPATTADAAYHWGYLQAQAVPAAWDGKAPLCGRTIFADVEGQPQPPGPTNGWNFPDPNGLNQKVWQGFYDTLGSPQLLFNPGLYSTDIQWNNIMGPYAVPSTTPVWIADGGGSPPCESCPTVFPTLPTIGGVSPTIWQYNLTPSCPNDLDAATELPPN